MLHLAGLPLGNLVLPALEYPYLQLRGRLCSVVSLSFARLGFLITRSGERLYEETGRGIRRSTHHCTMGKVTMNEKTLSYVITV